MLANCDKNGLIYPFAAQMCNKEIFLALNCIILEQERRHRLRNENEMHGTLLINFGNPCLQINLTPFFFSFSFNLI